MRVRNFPVACETLARILTTGAEHNIRVASGFPDDARLRGAYTEGEQIILVVESREFEDVAVGQPTPQRSILLEDRRQQTAAAGAGKT